MIPLKPFAVVSIVEGVCSALIFLKLMKMKYTYENEVFRHSEVLRYFIMILCQQLHFYFKIKVI